MKKKFQQTYFYTQLQNFVQTFQSHFSIRYRKNLVISPALVSCEVQRKLERRTSKGEIRHSSLYKHKMIRMFQTLSSLQNVRDLLKRSCLENRLPSSISSTLNFKKAQSLYYQISEMNKLQPSKAQNEWLENEIKLFHWILVCQSVLTKKLIQNFDQNDWHIIQQYFSPKSLDTLEYQYKKVLKDNKESYSLWGQQQKQKLIKIVNLKQQPFSWEDIARSLYLVTDKKFFKTGKQCSEQWFNHLDPTKKHGEWSTLEDLEIVRFALKNGHKWSLLCKNTFPHRTQHMVKNRFNSILRKHKDGQIFLAVNERKILKRIVKKLEEETLSSHTNKNKHVQAYQHVLLPKVTQNQVGTNKNRNSNIDKNPINLKDFPFLFPFGAQFMQNPYLQAPPHNLLQNSGVIQKMPNNSALVETQRFLQNSQSPAMWPYNPFVFPNFYWFGQKQ